MSCRIILYEPCKDTRSCKVLFFDYLCHSCHRPFSWAITGFLSTIRPYSMACWQGPMRCEPHWFNREICIIMQILKKNYRKRQVFWTPCFDFYLMFSVVFYQSDSDKHCVLSTSSCAAVHLGLSLTSNDRRVVSSRLWETIRTRPQHQRRAAPFCLDRMDQWRAHWRTADRW